MRELLITGGTIYTLDPARPTAEALLVRGQHIAAVGDVEEVRQLCGRGYELLDLGGGVALPGLCDAHVHLLGYGQQMLTLDLAGITDFSAALRRIGERAQALEQGTWLLGQSWDQDLWGGRWPTAADLDALIGDRPAMLSRKDLHSVWVSSAALRLAGIDASTPDPAGGEIVRDEHGQPTGILRERAIGLVRQHLPAATAAQRQQALLAALAEAARLGLTSLHCPEVPDPTAPPALGDMQALYAAGRLSARLLYHLPEHQLDEALALGLRSGMGDEWLRIGGIKLFSDGTLGSCTAHMLEPFEGTEEHGIPTLAREDLFGIVERAIGAGISVTVHAIGDAANRNVLDAIELALRSHPAPAAAGQLPTPPVIPNRIEHAQLLHERDLERFGTLGVVASMQPIHCTSDMDTADRLWGRRCATSYAWRSLLERGAVLAFGSDAPVESLNPWAGIHAAVTRQRPDSTPADGWHPEQRLTLAEALWAYTVGPAIASGELAFKGTLSPGKLADIITLREDLFQLEPAALQHILPERTIVGGCVVAGGR